MTIAPFTTIAELINDLVETYKSGDIESLVIVYKGKSDTAETTLHDSGDVLTSIGMLEVAKQTLVIERMGGL